MNPKWLGFLIFVWLFGLFIGGTYEGDLAKKLGGTTGGKGTIEALLSPSESEYSGTYGETVWWAANPTYWRDWFGVLTWNFDFCKPYDANRNTYIDEEDTNNNGVLDAGEDTNGNGVLDDERHNNDFGVYSGYFLHAFGIIGLAALIFSMFEFFQGFFS
jgi:hypothetical protein